MQVHPANFYDRIAGAAHRFGDRPAIEMTEASGGSLTYRDLVSTATRFAAWLASEGRVGRGDRVAILAANDGRWVAAYLGILRLGAVAVPLDVAYSADQIRTVLADCTARVLLTSDRLRQTGLDAISGLTSAPVVATLSMPLDIHRDDTPVVDVTSGDAAAILYTSGTTADPKGVVLTHGNLEAERAAALAIIVVNEDDVVLGVLPLFHALAQMANLLLPLSAGARVVFLDTVNSATLLDALQTRGVSVFACVPQFFYLIHQRVMTELDRRGAVARVLFRGLLTMTSWSRNTLGVNPGPVLFAKVHRAFGPRMRMLITGGSRFDPHIARDLHGLGLVLLNGYGLTETSGAATVMRPADRFTPSVGQALPGVEIRIEPGRHATADGLTSGSGEILIRGPIVMREYFNRPDATSEVLGADGWLRTGDLGHLDRDGRVYITGRLKDVIVLASGKNLYPEEIETHYRRSPFIKELCVLGVTDPDSPASERLHAIVVADDDVLRARDIVNQRELLRFEIETLAVALPAHKRVLSYDIASAPLPRTTTGKLKRREIARDYAARASVTAPAGGPALTDADRVWLAAGQRPGLVAAVAQRLGRREIRPDEHLELDLHLDSLERVEMLSMLEHRAGVRITPAARATIFTVRQLIEALESAPPGESPAAPIEGAGDGAPWQALLGRAPADAAIVADLERPAGLRAVAFFVFLRIVMTLARVFVRVEVTGREHLAGHGPRILAPNHQSYLDGFLIAAVLPLRVLRQMFFVGASEYFATPLTRRFARAVNIVPVDADANLVLAMQAAAAGLRLDRVLMWFPEGARTIDGTMQPFRRGVAVVATHMGTPVVPIGITGVFELWPRGRGFNWRQFLSGHQRITITATAPIVPSGESAAAFIRTLEQAVGGAVAPRT